MVFGNLFGFKNGRLFGVVPDYVDTKKAPGFSTLPQPTFWDWISGTPFVLIYSPNTVWAVIALAFYFAFPYDLSPGGAAARAPLSSEFFFQRFPLWCALSFGYTGFWHTTLFLVNPSWGARPFIKNRPYNLDKIAHNLFWSLSGVLIWTAFDNVFAFLWATGRLPYLSDADAFGSPSGFVCFLAGLVLVPVWRDVHFYFAHRLLHFKPLYIQVIRACSRAGLGHAFTLLHRCATCGRCPVHLIEARGIGCSATQEVPNGTCNDSAPTL
jgi:hypothetical protein